MPISRYLQFLIDSGNLQGYMDRLVSSFNPAAVDGLMCRSTLSVGWDGRLYDCDFNQMLDLGTDAEAPQTIFDATPASLAARRIVVGPHCFGCTAGAGSSCGGATVPEEARRHRRHRVHTEQRRNGDGADCTCKRTSAVVTPVTPAWRPAHG